MFNGIFLLFFFGFARFSDGTTNRLCRQRMVRAEFIDQYLDIWYLISEAFSLAAAYCARPEAD